MQKRTRCFAATLLAVILVHSEAIAELGVNLIPNPSFEEANGALPAGWILQRVAQEDPTAIEYPDASAPGADGTFEPHTGDRHLRFVNVPEVANITTVLDQAESEGSYTWIPIETGVPYRFQMYYRYDEVIESFSNARMELRIVFGYDANPGGVPEPTSFYYNELHYKPVSHPFGRGILRSPWTAGNSSRQITSSTGPPYWAAGSSGRSSGSV